MNFAVGDLFVWAPFPPMTPYYPPWHTGEGRGKGEKLTREKVGGAIVGNAGRKYQHDCLFHQ